MILIGQYDSPFVRRVAIALTLYGVAYEHRPWSVWADADRLAAINPLRRVPTLVLDGGEVLIESSAILDALDEMAGPAKALLPHAGAERRRGLWVCALSTGLADKAVSLFYEGLLRDAPSPAWIDRCRAQIGDVLSVLDADRATAASAFWLGPEITHADIAAACALRFAREAHPDLVDPARWPSLAAHADRCEALPAFQSVCQPLTVTLKES
ncbi:MAG TPA: glutathione S-transferase family protein [Caulobacteraceae bacterium]|jgi:glutathione S-transferase|nr:glutathione S-transferase family protein [Caulobacteraceae bacterium]